LCSHYSYCLPILSLDTQENAHDCFDAGHDDLWQQKDLE
jgi:hypothetical protein